MSNKNTIYKSALALEFEMEKKNAHSSELFQPWTKLTLENVNTKSF